MDNYYIIAKLTNGSYKVGRPIPVTQIPAAPVLKLDTMKCLTLDHEPTLLEQQTAFGDDPLSQAKASKQAALLAAAQTSLYAIFSALPLGPQAQLAPVEQAILTAAQSGSWSNASTILSTVIVPDALSGAQTAMVAAFAPFVTAAAALKSATVVDEVASIVIPS
jgi:hypothetical protein